jgi:hypothetical protein
MSTASVGRSREYKTRDAMVAAGWFSIMRAAASKGAADLLMAHPIHGAALVQVGSKSKALGPDERARLTNAAYLCSALAVLAIVIPHAPIRYWLVTNGQPSTWQEWTP